MIENYAQIASFIRDNQPFEASSVLALLNSFFVDSLAIRNNIEVKEGVLVFNTDLELRYRREKKDETKKTKAKTEDAVEVETPTHWWDSYQAVERCGYAIAPLYPLTKETVIKYQSYALLNALAQFGANVEELDDFDSFTPAPTLVAQAAAGAAIPVQAAAPATRGGPTCEECGSQVTAYTSAKGTEMTVEKQMQMTKRNYSKVLCRTCNAKKPRNN